MFYSIRGFDVLEKYLGDSSISEIMVIGASRIFVEQNGKIRRIEEHFSEEGDVYRLIEQIVAPTNRMVNEACPIVDSRLPDGRGYILYCRQYHWKGQLSQFVSF